MSNESRALRGKVHSYGGGYGYIIGENGVAYSVHQADIDDDTLEPGKLPALKEGDMVEFDPCPERSGNVATNVRKTNKSQSQS
jgi:cold shock CspA family protein